MRNYSFSYWMNALFHTWRLLFVITNPAILTGLIISLILLLVGYEFVAKLGLLSCIIGFVTICITPEKHYMMRIADKKLVITVFHAGINNSSLANFEQKAFLRAFFLEDNGKKLVIRTMFVVGYDDYLKDFGILLFKLKNGQWGIFSDENQSGTCLGKRMGSNLFCDSENVYFLHGMRTITWKGYQFDGYLDHESILYDEQDAVFVPLGSGENLKNVEQYNCSLALFSKNNATKIVAFGVSDDKVPVAYQLFVPTIHQINHLFHTTTEIKMNEDGSFRLMMPEG